MDQQIALSQEILSAIWILIYLAAAVLAVNAIRTAATVYRTFKQRVSFASIATSMFDRGKYDCLIDYCRDRLQKRPMDADAYFHLGRAYFRQKDYENAEKYFYKAATLEPAWKDEYIGAYLAQIEEERYSSSE
jgi:cytochrome c-type biogenesis protein CcmH/NrfG